MIWLLAIWGGPTLLIAGGGIAHLTSRRASRFLRHHLLG